MEMEMERESKNLILIFKGSVFYKFITKLLTCGRRFDRSRFLRMTRQNDWD